MALSEIIKQECPVCHKVAVEASVIRLGNSVITKLVCGHLVNYQIEKQEEDVYNSIVFSDGKKPRHYQIDAIKFAEEANFNCIIADEQGLGKTIEIGCILRLYYEKLLPAVITVPTTVKRQWMQELDRICVAGDESKRLRFLTQVIQSGKEKAAPGFQIYIVTFDMLKKEDLFSMLPNGYIKTVVVDECQRIKNHLSDRAKAVQRLCKNTEYHIPMSGTPIKNNAGEYFTVLNIVKPQKFPQYQRYLDSYCDTYSNGWGTKVGGLKDPEKFHEDTKEIIIRRTKNEVLKDLPALDRKFYHVELDAKLNRAYARALEDLDELMYSDENEFSKGSATIAIMSRMRHITGTSKVAECTDFVSEFLTSCERKIVIFSHHQDVSLLLEKQLNDFFKTNLLDLEPVCMMHSGLDGDGRQRLAEKFRDEDKCRVMIASTLAAGEGINLQFCSDAIMLERQWNPANEEQAEARFHRFGQMNNVSVTYMLASGTIDEYFTELVEQKRAIVAATMDNKEISWEQQSLMKDLTEMLLTKGRDRWRL